MGSRFYSTSDGLELTNKVWLQIIGALFIIGLNLFMTSVIMLFIKHVLRIPLRMSEEKLLIGDDAIHGEDAYAFGDVNIHQDPHKTQAGREPEFGVIQGESPSADEYDADVIQPVGDKNKEDV
jgi:Amt family ammonium transporter